MFCKNCGTNQPDGTVFCTSCGAPMELNNPVNPANPMGTMVPVAQPGKGLAVAAMVLGIISFFCFPIVTGVLGVIFGAVAKNKGYRGGMATAGIVCGIIGVALWLLMVLFWDPTAMLYDLLL